MTFAVNWYFGQNDVFGYHLVNIVTHLSAAFILYLAIWNLFFTPNLKTKYDDSKYFIALLAATLWAINPIQTQAVTYIVQRIAAMAALFYILGIYFYIKARLHSMGFKRIFFYLSCFFSALLAVASKENAATLPLALILVEIVFFQDISLSQTRKKFLWATLGVGLGILIIGYCFFLYGDPNRLLRGYENRFFTPVQRLLTEPRILLFYLGQILYPIPNRLSIDHDVIISTSLFSPWTTLPAIFGVLTLIGSALFQMRKWPLLSFAILFFFLNHLIESTIIGLELIFEHRNYLPSAFLFLPVAAGFKQLLDLYHRRKSFMHATLVSFLILALISIGIATYIRNLDWATEKSLWEDAISKAPGTSRPYHNLAWAYYEKTGQLDMAMKLYEKALNLRKHNNQGKSLLLNNMANLYYRKGDFGRACELWKETVELNPDNGIFQYRLAKGLSELGNWNKTLVYLDPVISKYPFHRGALKLKGTILLKQGRYSEALSYFNAALKLNNSDKEAMAKLGIGYRLVGVHDRARWFLKGAYARNPKNAVTLLWLIETYLTGGNKKEAERYLNKLIALGSFNTLQIALNKLDEDNIMPQTSREMVVANIAAKLKENSKALATH
jgi:tetratricopeptide (TPR) repeat protein